MKPVMKQLMILGAFALALIWPLRSEAMDFKRIVVFGTSLSDPGNAFALTGQAISKPYSALDAFLIPSLPYSTGGHHFSNGATWIEQLGRRMDFGEDVGPAFDRSDDEALNYAVGGARARADGINVNLPQQVATFLADVDSLAPADALYVIDIGANDVRDALAAPEQINAIFSNALSTIGAQVLNLYGAGARKFLILNVPNLGMTPALRLLDTLVPGAALSAGILTDVFNTNLNAVVASLAALPGIEIARLDIYRKVNEVLTNPAAFGLAEVTMPCLTPDIAPYTCKKPDSYLFWDGIHPTKAGHAILAREAARVLGQ